MHLTMTSLRILTPFMNGKTRHSEAVSGLRVRLPFPMTVFLVACATLASAQSPVSRSVDTAPAVRARSGRAPAEESPQQRRGGFRGPPRGVYKSTITPHWFQNDTWFWYRNDLRGGAKEFILVDAEKGTRKPAFDHAKLAAALSKAAGEEFKADRLPFSDIEFIDEGKAIKFDAATKTWKCNLTSYECSAVTDNAEKRTPEATMNAPSSSTGAPAELQLASEDPSDEDVSGFAETDASPFAEEQVQPQQDQQQGRGQGQGRGAGRGRGGGFGRGQSSRGPIESPDHKWTALVKDFNVFVRAAEGGQEFQLSQDGVTNNSYGRLAWAPDSQAVVAWRIEPGDHGLVYLVQSSPPGGGRAVLRESEYEQAGDRLDTYELNVFDIAQRKQIKPEVERIDYRSPNLRWNKDGYHFTYEKEDRGHQRFRVIEVDTHTGALRNLIDEKTQTFIWTEHTDAFRGQLRLTTYLGKSDEIIYESEQSGWRHLYLVDAKTGKMSPITKGEWVVRGVDSIDEDQRQIWFQASGIYPSQDPYFVHYARVNFDGTGLVFLTDGDGDHSIAYSPDRKYLIDTWSRVDTPPVNELRRASDGKLVCKLEQADISELKESGWVPLEPFVAKGRDGKTDIYGVIERPPNLDPSRKYPILEDIYAGPQGTPATMVPKSFVGGARHSNYTALGFIVVKIDGMGMPNRSKAFHDVCWHNLKDAGFPDRIAWMKAAAAKYPYMDITRVGIYGTSAGGQNAAGAVLFYPDFYKVAVANSGCHDNRLDKRSWNEQWMGHLDPDKIWSKDADNWYSQCSNIDNADKLGGKLFLIVGELDSNVPPESTLRFVDALIKARKDFEMLVVPGANHGAGSPITGRRTQDFLARHLLRTEPADRDTSPAPN